MVKRLSDFHGSLSGLIAPFALNGGVSTGSLDCPRKSLPWERPPNQYDPKCEVRFSELEATSLPPPDLPPMLRKLTVILGGTR